MTKSSNVSFSIFIRYSSSSFSNILQQHFVTNETIIFFPSIFRLKFADQNFKTCKIIYIYINCTYNEFFDIYLFIQCWGRRKKTKWKEIWKKQSNKNIRPTKNSIKPLRALPISPRIVPTLIADPSLFFPPPHKIYQCLAYDPIKTTSKKLFHATDPIDERFETRITRIRTPYKGERVKWA